MMQRRLAPIWALAVACGGGSGDSSGLSGGGSPSTSGATGTTADPGATNGDDADDAATDDGSMFDVGGGDGPPGFPTTCAEAEEIPSSIGCEFYPLHLPGPSGPSFGAHMAFVVSNVSNEVAHVVLSNSAGEIDARDVPPGEIDWFLDPGQQVGAGTFDLGFVIESDRPLQVFALKPPELIETNDATLVLPTSALGKTHRVLSFNDHYTTDPREAQWVAIAATQDDTEVTFTLASETTRTYEGSNPDVHGPALDGQDGPSSYTRTLARFEVMVIGADNSHPIDAAWTNELTGSLVEADKPIAVYSGSACSFAPACDSDDGVVVWPVPDECCCCDVLTTAVPPVTTWGKQYAGVKLLPRGDDVDIWRFIAHEDATQIQLTGAGDPAFELEAGEFFDIETAQSFVADGDRAFGLAHLMTSAGAAGDIEATMATYDCGDLESPGDPAVTWAYPTGNWMSRYVFPSGLSRDGTWCHDHATVVAPMAAWASITLDAQPLPAPTPLQDSGLGYAYVPTPDGTHELVGPPDVGIELTAYGFSWFGSYLYPGGMGLRRLNPAG